MNDDDATTLLSRLADRIEVGPVPLQDVIRAGERARTRRRRTAVLGIAAAVALVLLGGVGIRQALLPARPVLVMAGPNPSGAPAPPGSRLVGIGHAAIAVPADWGTNEVTCGKPTADTVIIDQGPVPLCLTVRPQTVSDVELQVESDAPSSPGFATARTVSVDGVPTLQTALRCSRQHSSRLCTQAVWVRQERALFTVSSPHPRTVRRLIGSVRVERGYVAVPGTYTSGANRDARAFVRSARALGLRTDRRVVASKGLPAGLIVGVHPAVGTLLRPGDTVRVTVSGGPGPRRTGAPVTASPGTVSSGLASQGPDPACALTRDVQRLVGTRTSFPATATFFRFPPRVAVQDPASIGRLVAALCAAPPTYHTLLGTPVGS